MRVKPVRAGVLGLGLGLVVGGCGGLAPAVTAGGRERS